jgi:hypothetical protein
VSDLTAGRAIAATSLTTAAVQASNSGGLALKNSGGTTQMTLGGGGGDNITLSVATNITPANAAVAISPTGTGTVAISPAGALTVNPTAASTINNTSIGVTTPAAGSFTTASTTGNLTAAVQVKSTNSTSTTQKYVIEKVYDLYKGSGPTTLDICDITSTYSSGGMYVEVVVTGQFNDFDGLEGSYLSAMVAASTASATDLIRRDGLIIGAINFSSVSAGVVRVYLSAIRSTVFNGVAYVRVVCGNASSGSNVDPSGVTIS